MAGRAGGRGGARGENLGGQGVGRSGGRGAEAAHGSGLLRLPRHAGTHPGSRAPVPDPVSRAGRRSAARSLAGPAHLAARVSPHRRVGVLVGDARGGGALVGRYHRHPGHGNGAAHRRRVRGARAHRDPGDGGKVPDGRPPRRRAARPRRLDRRRARRGAGAGRAVARRRRRPAALLLRSPVRAGLLGAAVAGGERAGGAVRRPAAYPRGRDDRGAPDGGPLDGVRRDRLSRERGDHGAARGAGPLRLGRCGGDRPARGAADQPGALPVVELEARQRHRPGPRDAGGGMRRGAGRGRRVLQQSTRRVR